MTWLLEVPPNHRCQLPSLREPHEGCANEQDCPCPTYGKARPTHAPRSLWQCDVCEAVFQVVDEYRPRWQYVNLAATTTHTVKRRSESGDLSAGVLGFVLGGALL